jgi:non-specific serine/threonine protein kinase
VLRLKEPFGDRLGMAMSIEMIAWAATLDGRAQEAATLLGAVDSALSSIGGALFRHLREDHESCVERTRGALGDGEYERLVAAGAALPFDDAVALALGQRRTGDRSRGPTSEPLGRARLTRRESEIARLVADGLSNREIAERLVLAQRTAEGHVQRILTKLDLASRHQVAGWLAEHGG